jgi:citrate lyase subunit beta/citryl-CoA lyase
MFVPGHNERLLNSAARSKADVLLLDVEDSVQPFENKQIARDKIIEFVTKNAFTNHKVFPRINDRESGQLLKDITQLTIDGVDGFMFPKACSGQDIYFIDKLLETIEYEKGFPVGTFKLIPLIETAAAVIRADEIAKSSSRIVAIAFGCEDFVSDLQGIHDAEGSSIYTPRAIIAMAARANNIIPIDTVHIKVHDLVDLERNLVVAKNLGFEGMLILNPKELILAHKYFSPSQDEINDAEEMLEFSAEAEKEGKGVVVKNGKFIGPPMVLAAKEVLRKEKLINSKEI